MRFLIRDILWSMVVVGVLLSWYVSANRMYIAEARLLDIDVLLDRWIDARKLTHEDRTKAIEELLKTRRHAAWFWVTRDHKFDGYELEELERKGVDWDK